MHRLTLSIAFGLLLAVGLALKVSAGVGRNGSPAYPTSDDIETLLSRNGFAISRAAPNTDPQWVYGVKGECRLQIANISPQGWHRSALEWHAGTRPLIYSVGGELHAQQPIFRPMAIHYLRRLGRYLGIQSAPVLARAIIIDPECPSDPISGGELKALS